MDWKKIRNNYPKAFEQFEQWDGNIIESNFYDLMEVRHLYEFFDQRGIYITPTCYWAKDPVEYGYKIFIKVDYWNEECSFKTRGEAEESAFEKSFEILENWIDVVIKKAASSPIQAIWSKLENSGLDSPFEYKP